MRGGEHRPGSIEHAGGVVHHVGRGEPEVDHVEAVIGDAAGELLDESDARRPHVAGDEDTIGVDELGEADTEGVRDRPLS